MPRAGQCDMCLGRWISHYALVGSELVDRLDHRTALHRAVGGERDNLSSFSSILLD